MSNTNGKQPLQLIRFHEGKFEVPEETQVFLSSFSRPLAVVSVVGKYRTGKSLFLNKVRHLEARFSSSSRPSLYRPPSTPAPRGSG